MTTEGGECNWRDTASVFVLGTLSETDHGAYTQHLLAGCGSCGAELEEARRAVAALDLSVSEADAARETSRASRLTALKKRLLTEVDVESEADPQGPSAAEACTSSVPSSVSGVHLIPASDAGWEETDIPGMQTKHLAIDAQRAYSTALIRMAPGTVFPPHRHVGREECYVISGDLTFGSHLMRSGDYQRAEPDSIHPEQSTAEGCLLLIVSSQLDERLSS